MIHIRKTPEIKSYTPGSSGIAWVKTQIAGRERYELESIEHITGGNAGLRNRRSTPSESLAYGKLTLLESGAVLASFPLLGTLPGQVQLDPFSVWFHLDAPAWLPACILGKELEIPAGRHLMTQAIDSWMVFFKPWKTAPV